MSIYIGEEIYTFKKDQQIQKSNFIRALKSTTAQEGRDYSVDGDSVTVKYYSWVNKEGNDRLFCQYRYAQ